IEKDDAVARRDGPRRVFALADEVEVVEHLYRFHVPRRAPGHGRTAATRSPGTAGCPCAAGCHRAAARRPAWTASAPARGGCRAEEREEIAVLVASGGLRASDVLVGRLSRRSCGTGTGV